MNLTIQKFSVDILRLSFHFLVFTILITKFCYGQINTSEVDVRGEYVNTSIKVNQVERLNVHADGITVNGNFTIDKSLDGSQFIGNTDGAYLLLGASQTSPDMIIRGNSHLSVNTITDYASTGMPNFPSGLRSHGNLKIGFQNGQRYIGTTNGAYLYLGVNNAFNMFIRSDGVIGGNFQNTSDRRLKSGFIPLRGAAALIQSLSFYQYTRKLSGNIEAGVIADELAKTIPHLVTGEQDAFDDQGNPKYQTVSYNGLVAYLGAALQESLNQIEELSSRLEELEVEVAQMKQPSN